MTKIASFLRSPDNWLHLLGHLTLWSMILGALVYYQERMLVCDSGYYSFHLINHEQIFVKHNRNINYLIQALPYLMIKGGAALQSVLMAYSIAGILFYYVLYHIATYLWRSPMAGLFVLMSLIFSMRYKHYFGHTEISLAIATGAAFVAWIIMDRGRRNSQRPMIYYGTLSILLALLYTIHPIIVIPILMCLGFEMIYHERWIDKRLWWSIAATVLAFGIKWLEVRQDTYESSKADSLASKADTLSRWDTLHVTDMIERMIYNDYALALGVVAVTLVYMLIQRKFLAVAYFILCNLLIVMMNVVLHAYLTVDIYFMLDGYMGMLGMLWALLIWRVLTPHISTRSLVWLIGLILTFSLYKIYDKHHFFTDRIASYKATFDDHPGETKIFTSSWDWERMYYPYQAPLETLIISHIEPDWTPGTIFIDYDHKGIQSYEGKDSLFINFYKPWNQGVLNPRFFKLKKQEYKYVRYTPVGANK